MHIDILRIFRDAVRWKRPSKWRTHNLYLVHDNAPARRSVLVKDFLAKNNVKHWSIHHSLKLAAADFYMLPCLKSSLKNGAFGMLLIPFRMRRTS